MIQGRVRAGLARDKSDGKKLTSDARRHVWRSLTIPRARTSGRSSQSTTKI
jgi:hypothetical protein